MPGFWPIALTGMASKLAPGMVGLSLLLLISRHHSFGTAGLAVSCAAIGQGATAPLRGRLVDRYPRRPVLLGCLAWYVTAIALLLVVVRGDGPPLPLLTLAAVMGATSPPAAVMMRSVWHQAAGERTLGPAMALDSAMTGAALVIGPALAGWLSVSVSPLAPLLAVASLTAGAVWLLVVLPTTPHPVEHQRGQGHGLRPLRNAPLRQLLAADALFVCAVTGMDVVLPKYAQEHGAVALSGWLLGALSLGSVLGSLALGGVSGPAALSGRGRRIPVLLCVFAAGAAALAYAALLSPWVVLLVCPVAGLGIGSAFAALRTTGGDLAPEGRVTETMAWLNSVDLAGGALGAAVFAWVAAAEGSGTALLLVPVVAVAAMVVGWSARTSKR
ncbi:MFS transporter [Streptomyces lasiicapitis]|uniref:MFS transporter n=1 Tax=Streptomyces lasiicapitis TaxID=1923961 RepID=UPI0036B8EAB7